MRSRDNTHRSIHPGRSFPKSGSKSGRRPHPAPAAHWRQSMSMGHNVRKAILSLATVAILAGAFFRLYHVDTKTFWGDEILGLIHMLGYTEAEIVRAGPNMHTASDLQVYFHLS